LQTPFATIQTEPAARFLLGEKYKKEKKRKGLIRQLALSSQNTPALENL
jgi:hypothetical protein